MHKLQLKRIYDPVSRDDGARILTDRLWPRGVKKEEAALTEWFKDISPSPELRKWFNHDPAHWEEFQRRYRQELAHNEAEVDKVLEILRHRKVTLLIAARDPEHNHGLVLMDYLQKARKKAS